MINHIITVHYNPNEAARKLYSEMETSGQRLYMLNAGSLLDKKDDPWISRNITFETDYADNIAQLNPHFCEMTAIYCAWKNMLPGWTDGDWVQHSHYRKFLQLPQELDPTVDAYVHNTCVSLCYDEEADKSVQMSNRQLMYAAHPRPDYDVLDETLRSSLDPRGVQLWETWSELKALPAPINIFALKARVFREYCEWAFPKLFAIDANIPYDTEEYQTAYQRRAMSFIGERLFSFWVFMKARNRQMCIRTVPSKLYEDFKPITDEEERRTHL